MRMTYYTALRCETCFQESPLGRGAASPDLNSAIENAKHAGWHEVFNGKEWQYYCSACFDHQSPIDQSVNVSAAR